jgi:Mg-chelatase subunit ChlD
MMPDVVFETPQYLSVLPVAAALFMFWLAVYFFRLGSRPVRTHGSSYPVLGHIKFWVLITAVLALTAVAAARPFFAFGTSTFQRGSVDVVIAVDGSASMWLKDVTGRSRLEIAAREILGLHGQNILTPRDRLALFVFGSTAVRKSHLSNDLGRFVDSVGRLRQPANLTGDAFPWSTDIASALEHVYHSIDNQDRSETGENDWTPSHRTDRLLLLFTDGDFTVEPEQRAGLEQALAECRRRGLTIYPIGIGSRMGREISEVLRDYQRGRDYDDILATELEEEPRSRLVTEWLTLMEQRTGGRTFVIENASTTATGFLRKAVEGHRGISFQLIREESRQEVWQYVMALAILVFAVAVLFY